MQCEDEWTGRLARSQWSEPRSRREQRGEGGAGPRGRHAKSGGSRSSSHSIHLLLLVRFVLNGSELYAGESVTRLLSNGWLVSVHVSKHGDTNNTNHRTQRCYYNRRNGSEQMVGKHNAAKKCLGSLDALTASLFLAFEAT